MARTGIGDAELARRIQVSRPTLVCWKEGVTARPRYREDVVRCAGLLRLTDEERAEFLAAAGFAPDSVPDSPSSQYATADTDHDSAPSELTSPSADTPAIAGSAVGGSRSRRRSRQIAGVLAFIVIMLIALSAVVISVMDRIDYPAAAQGESLIVMAPFANYTAGGHGFNVMGRLKEEIDAELHVAGLGEVRTAEWPEQIGSGAEAGAARRRSGASILIWGEYDSGRVMARFTVAQKGNHRQGQQVVDISSSPADLPATINVELTEEVRFVAMMTLGQLYLEREEFDRAKTVLIRAMSRPPSGPAPLAKVRFLLGHAYLSGDLADFDEAIWLFTQVLAVEPRSVEALNSRALAYLERGRVGDPDLAVDDLNRALTIRPERAATHLNLAVAHLERGSYDDIGRALNSLNEAISLHSDYASAYVNRAGAYIARGTADDIDHALDDIETALEIEPELASAHLNRGNAYLARDSDGDMQFAITEFSRAIQLAPDSPLAHFNRGLVYSELGDVSSSLRDLLQAHELSPNDVIYNRTLCRQLGVSGDPEAAWPFCAAAVAYDPDGLARDARGVVNALRGRSKQAIADFEAFLEWVDESPKNSCGSHYRASRIAWIESLSAGDNPFSPSTLFDLRARPVLPNTAPC